MARSGRKFRPLCGPVGVLTWALLVGSAAAQGPREAQLPTRHVMYELPTTQSRQLTILQPGSRVQLLRKSGDWFRVQAGPRWKGWIYLGTNGKARQVKPAAPTSASRSPVVARRAAPDRPPDRPKSKASSPGRLSPPRGDVSMYLGFFGGDFSYIGKFRYRNLPYGFLEGAFQYVAGKVISIYNMDMNFGLLWRSGRSWNSWVHGGFGVLTSVPVRAAGGKSISKLTLNYGIGIQKPLQESTQMRFVARQFLVSSGSSVSSFLEFSAGLAILIR